MRASSFAMALLVSGCTLVSPASEYFDERGVETIAVASATVDAMVVTGTRLYVAEGKTLYTKSVDDSGDLVAVTTASTSFSNLTTDGESIVAWCDEGAWFASAGGGARKIPGSSRCTSIGARDGVVAYVEVEGAVRVRKWDTRRDTAIADLVLPTTDPTNTSLGMGTDGSVHVGFERGLVRECLADDRGCEAGLCRVGSFTPNAPTLSVLGVGVAARVVWFDQVVGVLSAPVSACCPLEAKSCDADPLRDRRSSPTLGAFAVRDGLVYLLRDGSVKVVDAFADPTKDVVVAPSVQGARFLAIGEGRAVFTEGSKILRSRFTLVR